MDIICDLLDMPLIDSRGEPVGRVDGVIAHYAAGQPLRVVAIEVSASTLARRIHPRLAQWMRALSRRFGPSRGCPCRIPLSQIDVLQKHVRVKNRRASALILVWERLIRDKIVRRIPGA